MYWYWKVRIYNAIGNYWTGQIQTERSVREIDTLKDFYEKLTNCKMLLEGMSETRYEGVTDLHEAFYGLWAAIK